MEYELHERGALNILAFYMLDACDEEVVFEIVGKESFHLRIHATVRLPAPRSRLVTSNPLGSNIITIAQAGLRYLETPLSVIGNGRRLTVFLQAPAQQIRHFPVIFDDQNFHERCRLKLY